VANTLTNLIPIIYEGLDVVSREMIGAIPAVSRDSSLERVAVGQSVRSHVAPAVTASDIVPNVTPPNDGDQTFGYFDIKISNAKRVPIRWNGEEQRGLSNGGPSYQLMMRDQWAQAFRTLANLIEADVIRQSVLAASRATGTPGTSPFGVAGDFSDFANAHIILDDNGAPMSDRQMILGSAAMGNLRGRQSVLFKANEAGTDQLLREGIVGRVEGFDLHLATQGGRIVAGTGANYTVAANTLAGATTLNLTGGTGTINPGDVINIAGDPNFYMVTGTGITGPGTITIGNPGLRIPAPAAAAVTLGGSYYPNLALSKSASRLVTRAPALPTDMSGQPRDMATDRTTVTDPVSGISFEISEYLQYRQVQYEVAIVWGYNVTKQNNIAILRG
jgi:hypothetical protein